MQIKFERVDGAAGSGTHRIIGRDDMNRVIGIDVGPVSFKQLIALKPQPGDMLDYDEQAMSFAPATTAAAAATAVSAASVTKPVTPAAGPMPFSISDMLDEAVALAGTKKRWGGHNRSDTVGASEVGRCARFVWYDKNDFPVDPGAVLDYGAMERGNTMESWAVERMQESIADRVSRGVTDMKLLWATDAGQKTLVDGYQSATPDGLFVSEQGMLLNGVSHESLYNELKSIDPRAFDYLTHAKPEHVAQVQQGMDLVRRLTEYEPEAAIITYVNASFVSQRREFFIAFDPAHAAGLRERANYIMNTDQPPAPEGKIAGGRECDYCPFFQRCRNTQLSGLVEGVLDLPATDKTAARVIEMLRDRVSLKDHIDHAETQRRGHDDELINILKDLKINKLTVPGFSVSMRKAYGPPSYDTEKMLAAGINPDDYKKPSSAYMRLDIRTKK